MARPILLPGDPVPDFKVRSAVNPQFRFNTVAGRYVVLCFFGSAASPTMAKVLAHLQSRKDFFNDIHASFFGVSIDTDDETLARVKDSIPGYRYFWDFDRAVSTLYGAADAAAPNNYYPFTLILDPMLRVIAFISLADAEKHNRAFDKITAALPDASAHAGVPMHAPVLVLPRVFEPEFCKELIGIYEKHGGKESGFMREVNGKTVGVKDSSFKRRKDFYLEHDEAYKDICAAARTRIARRLIPEIARAFQFKVTRMERYVISCYDSMSGGFFMPHRDNTTKGTAHRRFACTLNLNTEEYEGGDLRFPEFGTSTYRAPTGGAVVFSCSLLHEATPVTKGKRYAFLPFFYDDAAAKIRAENLAFLSGQMIDKDKGEDEYLTGILPSSDEESSVPGTAHP